MASVRGRRTSLRGGLSLALAATLVLGCGGLDPGGPSPQPSAGSPDAQLAWTTEDLDRAGGLWDLIIADERTVAVGYEHWEEPAISTVLISDDTGLTWEAAAADSLDAGRMMAVAAGPAGYVAVGRAGERGPGLSASIWMSVDGTSWRAITDSPTDRADLATVVASGERYVAGGSDGTAPAVFVSDDGSNWRAADPFYDPPPCLDVSASCVPDTVTALAVLDGRFLAALSGTREGEIWASAEGLAWARVGDIREALVPILGDEPQVVIVDMASDGSRVLAIGRAGHGRSRAYVWASTDGATWTTASLGTGEGLAIAIGPDGLAASSVDDQGRGVMWSSLDGLIWSPAATEPGTAIALALTAAEDGYLAVGSRGATVDESTVVVWHGRPAR